MAHEGIAYQEIPALRSIAYRCHYIANAMQLVCPFLAGIHYLRIVARMGAVGIIVYVMLVIFGQAEQHLRPQWYAFWQFCLDAEAVAWRIGLVHVVVHMAPGGLHHYLRTTAVQFVDRSLGLVPSTLVHGGIEAVVVGGVISDGLEERCLLPAGGRGQVHVSCHDTLQRRYERIPP